MGEQSFVALCKAEVIAYVKHTFGKTITLDDVYVVWLCKTLQNNKALLSTTLPDGLYYEMTYNGDKQEMYVDVYEKMYNYTVVC
jgi:hypothetical protein